MKIKDRIILGVIAGITGTTVKTVVVGTAKRLNLAEFNGAETAAGILLPAFKVNTPGGRIIGHIANYVVGGSIGVGLTYLLSLSGKDKAAAKGAFTGLFTWTALYGLSAQLGASSMRPALPKTLISNMIGHVVHGVVSSTIIAGVGDPGLFNGNIPLSSTKHQTGINNGNILRNTPGETH